MLDDAHRGESNCLLLHGEAGIGKTTLLEYAVAHAEGVSVLRVEGIESEMELAFGGLHQLLLPVLERLDLLPPPQAGALRAVFGLSDETVRDRLTIGLATLSLLSEAGAGKPLLCVVDDLQWLDRPSVDALVFAARRLRAEGVVMLFATRETSSVSGAKALPHVPVTGVDRQSASSMLPGLAPPVSEWIIDQAQGNPLLALGRHDDSHAHAAEALRLAEAYDLDHRAAHLRALLAVLAAARGEEEHARELAGLAMEYTRPRDVGRGTADALWALGLLDLGLGRAQDALAHLEAARHAVGHPLLTRHLMPDLIEAAVRAGHPERAREPAKQLMSWADDLQQPHFMAQAHRCAALTGPDASAEKYYASALDLHDGGCDFERARTELLYGEWLRRGRRKLDARDHLRTARELFDKLGAQPWARRAATELQAAGETSHPADAVDSPIGRLSSQEREVVRLAATGATNREIATRLFLSPRTVGHHLYRAFPKLGISSRTELADLLAS